MSLQIAFRLLPPEITRHSAALDATAAQKAHWRTDGAKRYVVFQRDQVNMKRSADRSKEQYQIPRKNISEHRGAKGFYSSFDSLDLNAKLDIHGHANTLQFERMSAKELAGSLEAAGLKKVGVIKFKACDLGKSTYLEELKSALTEKNIQVGYSSAPKYGYMDSHVTIKVLNHKFAMNAIPFLPKKMIGFPFLPSKFGRKVIKGNADDLYYKNEPKYKAGLFTFG